VCPYHTLHISSVAIKSQCFGFPSFPHFYMILFNISCFCPRYSKTTFRWVLSNNQSITLQNIVRWALSNNQSITLQNIVRWALSNNQSITHQNIVPWALSNNQSITLITLITFICSMSAKIRDNLVLMYFLIRYEE
jgi:hypothetical protein